ncbi:MAG: polyphosphate kinase 1 [Herpetosiphon sp.]
MSHKKSGKHGKHDLPAGREETTSAVGSLSPALEQSNAGSFFNRELSWLQFNRRVLAEASSLRHPLLERVKFLAIFSANLDEFFMVRVAGIRGQIEAGISTPSIDGRSPNEQLAMLKPVVAELTIAQHHCWTAELQPLLRAENVFVCDYAELDQSQRAVASKIFHDQVFPVLTPLAFDPHHPFPHISNLSLNLAVVINNQPHGERFARVKVPSVLPRLMELPTSDGTRVVVWMEQLIAAHIDTLFPGMEVTATYPFKVTRDGDVALQDEESADLLALITANLRQRSFGRVVRLAVDESMPPDILELLVENLQIEPDDVYRVLGPLALGGLMQLAQLDRPDLKDIPTIPAVPTSLASTNDPFAVIRSGTVMLHHPFDSFTPVVDLLYAAADDPQVLAIKQTLYRVGRNAPIVDALMRAREHDKQVTVLVELKARFDEENNIEWAKQLEQAGVHVVYGLPGLKTHCKLMLIVRKESDRVRRYIHLSTGNYNVGTARLYTDIGLLTCDDEIGADVSDLFNYLTGYSAQHTYRQLSVAPINLRQRLIELIKREIVHQQKTSNGALILKMNTLTDPQIITTLYQASQAGVAIDLIVRGACCLRPGVTGLSETIRVRSIVGRFLEHSRIYYFRNGGAEALYLSSADMMSRNLDRRVEVLFPVSQVDILRRIRDVVLDAYFRDTVNTHLLQPDGTSIPPSAHEGPFDCQAWLLSHRPVLELPTEFTGH